MRIHLVACAYVLFFASQLSLSRGEMACLLLAIGGVMTAETLNTALEKLCDFAQKNLNRYIRVIKDMAAGFVFLGPAWVAERWDALRRRRLDRGRREK